MSRPPALTLALAAVALVACTAAGEPDGLIASKEPGWPQWRGPRRDGLSDETGLLQSWPERGPKLLWTASGLGRGYSSPIVTRGAIYITGDVGKELHVFALDLKGEQQWHSVNGRAWPGPYPGARATCAYTGGRVYHTNAHARVACLDAKDGREVWAVNMLERFDGKNIKWGISESVLVQDDKVYVTPGGQKAQMAALDATTGETVWASRQADGPGYASPILFRLGGRRLLVNQAHKSVVCVDADTGVLYWIYPKRSRFYANCATPVFWSGATFHTTPSGSGGVLLRSVPTTAGVRVEKVWECGMDNISGGAVALDGHIYGSGQNNTGWVCMDARTGEAKHDSKELVQGSLIYADGCVYRLSQRGVVALARAEPKALDIVSRFRLPGAKGADAWAHPVICDGRLYLRYHDNLYCYDVRRPPAP